MNDKLILSGIHVSLTPGLKQAIEQKTERLFRHYSHIIRLRVDLEHDQTKKLNDSFVAKAHIEIDGPDLIASTVSDDGYKSIDLLVDKLDELLRRRNAKRVDSRSDGCHLAPDILHGKK